LPQPAELRAAGDAEEGVLFGEFARFNEWTEINSMWEGRFLERIAPGAFDRAIAEDLDRVKVLYDHGHDPQLGNKPLGTIRSVTPTKTGVAYEVDLIDTDYNAGFIKPAARAGLLGASFRFGVRADSWVEPERATKSNPEKLPERTLTDVRLHEFGPVTFPAYAGASASMRSDTDEWLISMLEDPERFAEFAERTSMRAATKALDDAKQLQKLRPKAVGLGVDSARVALLQFVK
jgi:HK97 family phage prohead protease